MKEEVFRVGRNFWFSLINKLIDSAILTSNLDFIVVGEKGLPGGIGEIDLDAVLPSGKLEQIALGFHLM